MNTPAVSVLLPIYNAEATLAETLESVLAQTLDGFELVAVDDGSADASAAILRSYAEDDSRIRLLQPGRGGVVAAMNHALTAARAPLVARMDADDIMHSERLARQVAFLDAHPDIALLGSRVRLFPEELVQEGFREYIRWQNGCLSSEDMRDEIYVELPIAHPSVMFRRDVVLGLGGYRDGNFPEDYELLLRLHRAGERMAKLEEVLLHWRESEGRLTRTDPRYAREAFDRLRAEYLAQDPRMVGRTLAFWGAGRKTRQRCAHLIAHGLAPSAWIDIDPRKIGNRLKGVPVHGPEWLAEQEERPLVLCYVSNHGARELIAADLQTMGYRRGLDYLMVG